LPDYFGENILILKFSVQDLRISHGFMVAVKENDFQRIALPVKINVFSVLFLGQLLL